eukprot:828166_1
MANISSGVNRKRRIMKIIVVIGVLLLMIFFVFNTEDREDWRHSITSLRKDSSCERDPKELGQFFKDYEYREIMNENVTEYSDWMSDLMDFQVETGVKPFKDRTVQEIVLPGTHDAGAYGIGMIKADDTSWEWDVGKIESASKRWGVDVGYVSRAWCGCQAHSIYEQLISGVRYL